MSKLSQVDVVPGSAYRWQVVAMLWCICFFNYADRQAIYAVFPILRRDLLLSPVQLGLLGSAFAWVYALAGPLAGRLVDRVRRRTAVLSGLEVWSILCALTALSHRFSTLLLLRGAEGLGESIYFPASMSMLAAYHPGRTRSLAFGAHQTSIYVGTIAGGLLAGWTAERYGWRSAFVLFGGMGMLLGLILLAFLREPPVESDRPVESIGLVAFGKLLLRQPSAMLLMLAFAAMNGVAVVQLSWMPNFLFERYSLGLAKAALYATATAQTGAALGALTGGLLADRQAFKPGGRIRIQILGAACGLPFVAVSGLSHTLPLALLALVCWGFCKGLYDANIFASLFDVLPAGTRGISAGSMNSMGWLLGGTIAPVLIGFLSTRVGLGGAIAVSSLGYLFAAALLLAAFLLARRQVSVAPA